jgi:hypothetical protein
MAANIINYTFAICIPKKEAVGMVSLVVLHMNAAEYQCPFLSTKFDLTRQKFPEARSFVLNV